MANHAFRCRACSPLIRGENHYAWRGDAAHDETKRKRARALYALAANCESCGKAATDRHHKDSNPGNNEPENIAFLCRRCHMLEDGRLQALLDRNYHPDPCSDCGRSPRMGGFRHGLCGACRVYFARHGRKRPVHLIVNGRVRRLPDPPKPCRICARLMKPLRRGRCGACNEYLRRNGFDRPMEAAA